VVRAMLVPALATVLAACAASTGSTGTAAGGVGTTSTGAGSTSAGSPSAGGVSAGSPGASGACGVNVVVSDSGNGSTVCVALGSQVTVLLRSGPGGGWTTPQVSGAALGPPRGVPTPNNAVGWAFEAVAAGTADVTTSRPVCPVNSGALRCHSLVSFRVHVEVR